MNLPKLISAPLPWLTLIGGRILGRTAPTTSPKIGFSRTLKFTKEGWRFVFLLLLIGVAAVNTGNNLLYLVVATLLSLIIISGIMSELTLKNLTVKRVLPPAVFRNSPVPVKVTVENRKRLLASYSFWVEELTTDGLECEPFYVVKLDGREKKEGIARYRFTRRGRIRLEGVALATRFPFGFFVKKRRLPLQAELIVYPAIVAMRLPPLYPQREQGTGSAPVRGAGDEIRGLEDYTLMDDAKHIHWKASARAGRLVKKEFETERQKRVAIVFENRGPEGEAFENTVDRAATLANHYLSHGYEVALKTLKHFIPHGRGTPQLHRILKFLAEVRAEEESGTPSVRVEP